MSGKTREIRIDGDVAYVPLTGGYEAIIDADDVGLVSGVLWCSAKTGNAVYAVTRRKDAAGKPSNLYMHRLLMGHTNVTPVDHRDLNGLNNRKANLRIVSVAENAKNCRLSLLNRSGVKGVSWRQDRGKWQVHIRIDYKRISLGHFSFLEDAAAAYAAASVKYHGEFGRVVNEILPPQEG
jgi:hypothetical protein